MKLACVRNEIHRPRLAIRAQQSEIEILRRAGASTALAELLLAPRMRAKVDTLCRQREALRQTSWPERRARERGTRS